MTLIDSHVHLFAPEQRAERRAIAAREPTFAEMYGDPRAKMAVFEDLKTAMADAALDRAVVAGFAFDSAAELNRQNDYILGCRTVGHSVLATVNPALDGWEGVAQDLVAGGASGFGELRPHNQGWEPLGTTGRALCELAGELAAVLLWHVSEPVGHSYPGKTGGILPSELIQLAVAYPSVTMVGAHLGGGASFYLQMPEVSEGIERLYFDTAASTLLYDEGSVARLAEVAGAERILFGSDFPLQSPKRQIERLRSWLSPNLLPKVLGENAARLFPKDQR